MTERRFRDARTRHNPPLAVFGNPPEEAVGLISKHAIQIRYIHAEDGKPYQHDFGDGVCLEALPDGSVRIYGLHGQPVWGNF